MFSHGSRQALRGFREGDTGRMTAGALLLLFWAYRRHRERSSLIASYELREGEELRLSLPRDRWVRADDVAAAVRAELEPDLPSTDLDDDLLAPPAAEDEGQQGEDDHADDE